MFLKPFALNIFLWYLVSVFMQQPCRDLPSSFRSYQEAINKISSASFVQTDNANTSKSSFITSANFYSCNGQTGYLIIGINNRPYIHKDLPVKLWYQFKNARSFGTFYTQHIRNKYRLSLTSN
ncbi:KTSC domain-containing protein [Daejeonella sp.]|uniref:KTSC domain-containing protein n=1 Tax=Daejeonella sp. TaxID=2805397 RepID=UPI0039C88C5A